MTKDEAKGNLIHAIRWNDMPQKEALEMAIEALEQEPCEDCISREDARELMYHKQEPLDEYDLDSLPSVIPMSRWIPVSERLPEEREWYLAVFKEIDTGFQLIPRVADYIGNGENEWRIIDEDGLVQEYRCILECVAWMPLPEPYNPQESEGK